MIRVTVGVSIVGVSTSLVGAQERRWSFHLEGQDSLGSSWTLKGEWYLQLDQMGGKTFQSEGIRKAKDGGKSAGWCSAPNNWVKLEFWAVEEGGGTRDGPEERSRGQPMTRLGCRPKEFRLHSAHSRGHQQSV